MRLVALTNVARFADGLEDISDGLSDVVEDVSGDIADDVVFRARMVAGSLGGVFAHSTPGIDARGNTLVLARSQVPTVVAAEFGRDWLPQFPPHTEAGRMLTEALLDDETLEPLEQGLDEVLE